MTHRSDLDACLDVMTRGSSSFTWASRMLPPAVRRSTIPIYAFCRVADDLVDLGVNPLDAVDTLHTRLDDIFAGHPADDPVDRELARVIERHDLPRAPFDCLIEGFEWDALGGRYETLDEVIAYCVRVASSVGVLITLIMGRRDSETLARACDLGIAMQLTNIARDVGADARAGRCYLPASWLEDAGVDRNQLLARPEHSDALGQVVARLLVEAAMYYDRSESGISRLPAACRTAIWAARLIYAEIGEAIRENQYDAVSRRAYTSRFRKALLLNQAVIETLSFASISSDEVGTHPAAQGLVRDVARAAHGPGRGAPARAHNAVEVANG